MFKRLATEDWHTAIAIFSFVIFSAVFVAAVIRAIRMSRERVRHLSELPLAPEKTDHER
jgi:hypothetical protein